MKFRRLRDYSIAVDGEKVLSITCGKGIEYKRVYPYRWSNAACAWVRVYDPMSFGSVKSSFYKKTLNFF